MPTKSPEQARRWAARILADESNTSGTAKVLRHVAASTEPFDVDELSEALGVTLSSVYLVLGDMRRAGYPVVKVRSRVFHLTGEQGPDPYPVEYTGRRVSGALVHVPRNGHKLPPAFLRAPAEGLPALGEVLRVAMLAEADGGEALVLQGADGKRYMVHVDGA